jgi:ABC-2 type transport system permease protein
VLFSTVVVVLLAGSSLAAGILLVGRQPLVGLSGTLIPPGHVAQPFYGPLQEGPVTSAAYFLACLAAAYLVFRRRDIVVG